jgi:hypothetical protein
LKDKNNPTFGSNRSHVPSKRQLFGKFGAKSKKSLRKSIPDTDTYKEGNVPCMFYGELFPHQNPEKIGLMFKAQ